MYRKPRVLLIGGLPRPSGGVTVFLGRLVNQLAEDVAFHVLDIHQGEKEPTKAVSHRIAPKNRLLKSIWLFLNIVFFRGDIVHFNFSQCHALLALVFIPKFNRRFFMTLHNGCQVERWASLGWCKRALVKLAAGKIDIAFSLCDNHDDFYRLLNLPLERLVHTKSQIPPPAITALPVDDAHEALRSKCDHILVSSGHVNRSYNYEFLIEYVNARPSVGGILFLYGEAQDLTYLKQLQSAADKSRVIFYFHQDEKTFLSALAYSDAYLRPTHVDSWGIAVADSISLGVPAIASDVCERSEGAIICDSKDYTSFTEKLDCVLFDVVGNDVSERKSYFVDYVVSYCGV